MRNWGSFMRLAASVSLCVAFALTATSRALMAGSGSLPVPVITIYPGEVIKDEWLVEHDFSAALGTSTSAMLGNREAIVGKVARRTLLPGSPIPSSALANAKVVANGAKVRLVFEDGILAITAYGTALQAGSAGDVISVRNLASGLTISGTVQGDGSVRVGGG